jgi:competence protein ComEC
MVFLPFLSGVVLFYIFNYFPFSTISAFVLSSIYLIFRRKFSLVLILLLGIAFAFLRYEPEKDISHIGGKEVIVKGVIQSYPVQTESGIFKQSIEIKSAVDRKTRERLKELSGKGITLLADREFSLGTEYEISIQFLKERLRQNPGSMASNEIYARLLEVHNTGSKSTSLNSQIQEFRYRLNRYFSDNFKGGSAAFVSALTTGQRASINEDLRNAFNATGLAHILSISGTHFGLFSVFLFSIFRFLIRALPYRILQRITIFLTPSQAAAILCFPFMLAYLGLSGGSIPAVRSFIMIGLFLLGLIIGRKGFWLNTLLFAALVLILWEPEVIIDLSFQLSFLAVLFIGFSIKNRGDEIKQEEDRTGETKFSPVIRKFFMYLKNALLLTLSASIGTAPLVAYHFHYFSIISPVSNLFITPIIGFVLVPLSILSSFLFLITGHYIFTPVVSTVSDISISLVRFISEIPYADIKVPSFPPIIVLLFYAGFLFYFLFGRSKNIDRDEKPNNFNEMPKQVRHDSILSKGLKIVILNSFQNLYRHFWWRKRYTLLIPFIPILIYFSLTIFERKELTITYLDVGQGDSSVIELPDGKTIVIDTGRTGRETTSFLKYKGKKEIGALALSHVHPDHIGGLDYIIKRFKVKEIWDNGRIILPEDYFYQDKIKHRVMNRGDVIEGEGYSMYVFHPYSEFYTMYGNDYVGANNDSLVIKIEGRNKSFIFPGDVEEEAEEDLLSLGKWLKSDVIKVPHHGGKTSAYKPFLELVSPEVAVISSGRDNSFGHPHQETLDALQGVSIFRTDIDGAIKIKESEKGLEIKTYKDSQFVKSRSFQTEIENIKKVFMVW